MPSEQLTTTPVVSLISGPGLFYELAMGLSQGGQAIVCKSTNSSLSILSHLAILSALVELKRS
jgi:hypothetical protein